MPLLDEGADPLVRGDENVRPLVDGERLEEVERIGVEAVGIVLEDLDLHPVIAAGGLQHTVQLIRGGDDVAGTQGSGAIGA